MATFSVHFDGPITIEHRVSIRVLARTYEHMQRAIDRAYLVEKYGEVWKHQRLTLLQYPETEFLAEYPRPGGIILDAVRAVGGEAIIDRIGRVVRRVYEPAVNAAMAQHDSIATQLVQRRQYIQALGANLNDFAQTYEQLAQGAPAGWGTGYSDRSIVKEIDQLVQQITPRRLEGSTVELALRGQDAQLPFVFDRNIAKRFHKIAARRELGPVIIVTAVIRALDRGNNFVNPNAKVLNASTNREVNLMLSGEEDFAELHPHHNGARVRLYVCPIIEASGFDLTGGDLMFIAVA